MMPPQIAYLPDGRLHLHHGPIDLIVSAEGSERAKALDAAWQRFDGLLAGLVSELDCLRRPVLSNDPIRMASERQRGYAAPLDKVIAGTSAVLAGSTQQVLTATATRMVHAVAPFADTFVTPMAAVAGAVADEVLSAMTKHRLTKAIVNNGGDVAFHLGPRETFHALSPAGTIDVTVNQSARGLATSGWRGRSHSLGIADAVTVLAQTAADADVAATLIANAVDLPGHPNITREPANALSPDSDLGHRLVTTEVGSLTSAETNRALDRGAIFARTCLARGTILAATLTLKGQTVSITKKDLAHA